MTFELFEGAAGTGKTHSMVTRAAELVQHGALGEEQKLLALTFMNGARHRLYARLGEYPIFRSRFDCQTFDVFARMLAARRRSLITQAMTDEAAALGEFDGPCSLAADLLACTAVREWAARTFPLVLVDEAQDLDQHRLNILKGLSHSCRIVAAADAFQCLDDDRDTDSLMQWFEGMGQPQRLTQVRRTQQQGLLDAALAVREGRDLRSVLTAKTHTNGTTWNGAGFRLREVPVKNSGLLAWSIASEIEQRHDSVVVVTPHASDFIRDALTTVQTKQYKWKTSGTNFGPFPVKWENRDEEEANAILADITLPDIVSCADAHAHLKGFTGHAPIALAIRRMDRIRRTTGQVNFAAAQFEEFVREAVRNRSRVRLRQQQGNIAMTIQRAKNREFPNLIVLWPHTATGSPERLRRLLYNAITRAQNHCTVIVFGQDRLNTPPFAPPSA